MKKLIALVIATSCVSFSACSQAMEHCPELTKIQETGKGVYRADGVNGEWSGVVQGVVADSTPVQSFQMALAIQENAASQIKLQHCTYMVGPDKTLDMRFIPKNGKSFTIKLEGNAWKKEGGSLGLIYSVCEKHTPTNCKFTVHQ